MKSSFKTETQNLVIVMLGLHDVASRQKNCFMRFIDFKWVESFLKIYCDHKISFLET